MTVAKSPMYAGGLSVGGDFSDKVFCLPALNHGGKIAPLKASELFAPALFDKIVSAKGNPVELKSANVMNEETSSNNRWQVTAKYDKSTRQLEFHGQLGAAFATLVLTFDSNGNVSAVSGEPFRDFVVDLVLGLQGSGVFTAEGFSKLKRFIRGMKIPNFPNPKEPPIFT